MEQVVERGTATAAKIDGFTIAGKTGTAQKLVDHRYSHSDYNASFVGFLPSRKPALAIIVVIDSPHANGYYGGTVAAPIFKRIAQESLRHLGIGPTINPAPPVLVARNTRRGDDPAAGERVTDHGSQRAAIRIRGRRRRDAGLARAQRARSASRPDEDRDDGADVRRRVRPRAVACGRQRTRHGGRLHHQAG